MTKRFGAVAALQRLDLRLEAGTHLLLAGPNGAGKTTLLRLIAGLARPHGGQVRLAGADPRRDPAVRCQLGLLSHQPLFYADLTCAENLHFFARLYGLDRAVERVPEALARVGLWDRREQRAGSLSRGMTQRLALARATLHRPRLLLLDEPFTGLDVRSAADLTTYLEARAAEPDTASVLVTHRAAEAAGLVNRVLLLERGRVRGDWPWPGGDG
ncbi:MAG: heme ABC exporter ATP-binding protein CcmA, partial [Gemmatimonadota bacterium]